MKKPLERKAPRRFDRMPGMHRAWAAVLCAVLLAGSTGCGDQENGPSSQEPAPPLDTSTAEQTTSLSTSPPFTTLDQNSGLDSLEGPDTSPPDDASSLGESSPGSSETPTETTAVTSKILPEITSTRYGYYQLTTEERAAYDALDSAARRFEEKPVKLPYPLSGKQVERVCNVLTLEENDLFYLAQEFIPGYKGADVLQVRLQYQYTRTEAKRMQQAVDERASEIVRAAQGLDTVDKIKLFHDTIIKGCSYSLDTSGSASAYGALIKGQARCEGYAHAFAVLCNKAGIENCMATGTIENNGTKEPHMWNMVKVAGEWYNVDLTLDDPIPDYTEKYPIGADYVGYNYLLFPTGWFGLEAEVETRWYTPPEATAMQDNYYVHYGYYATDYDAIKKRLGELLREAVKKKQKYVNFRVSTPELYEYTRHRLFKPNLEIRGEDMVPTGYVSYFNPATGYAAVRYAPSLNVFQIILKYDD